MLEKKVFFTNFIPDLLQDVLPLLQALFAHIGHLLDGHDLAREIASRIVDGAEGAMANLAEILEYLLWVVLVEELRYLRVLQAPRPGDSRHREAASTPTLITLTIHVLELGDVAKYSMTTLMNFQGSGLQSKK